jgi:hypothetical protein
MTRSMRLAGFALMGALIAAPAMAQSTGQAGQNHGTRGGDVGNPSANGAVVGSGSGDTGNTGTAKSTRATGVSIGQNAAGAGSTSSSDNSSSSNR